MALNIQAVVSLDTKMFTAGIRGIEAQINQFANLAVMQFGGVAQQISAMWGAFGPAGAAITTLGAVVQAGAGYEQQMARVASYTQASAEEIQRLSDAGVDMVASFGFSAQQVGESMASLALAGVETANMTDVLQASLLLASATLGDANQSAELITSTLKVFQEDMGKAVQTADLFAGAIASSPLDLQRLSDAMKYAGSTGAAFGMSMQDVVSEIAAFHQVGLRGQMAGTAFRGAILEMSAAASSAKGVVGQALQGWDAGTEGLTGAIRRLNAAGADAGQVIQELGKRAGPGVAALMKLGSDAMEDLSGKIRANANVSAMHERQMDTLAGQYKLLQGEVVSLATRIYEHLLPGFREALSQMRGGVQTFADVASKISGLSGIINVIIPGLARFAGTVIALNVAIKGLNFVGINTGIQSFGGLFAKIGESRKAAAQVLELREELKKTESALRDIHAVGEKGIIPTKIETAQLSDLRGKANAAKDAFNALQTQGAQPFISEQAFAALPQLSELNRKIADTERQTELLQGALRRLKFDPSPEAEAQWRQLASVIKENQAQTEKYRKAFAALEAQVEKNGLANYNAALAQSENGMKEATDAADKFQQTLSEKGVKSYTDALEANNKTTQKLTTNMKAAQAATGGWTMGLSGLQVALVSVGTAIAAWNLGKFIGSIKIADRTITEWAANAIASMMDARASVEAADADIPQYLQDIKKHCQELRDAGRDMANTFINEMPQSNAWAEALRASLDDMDKLAQDLEKDLQKALSFGGTDIASQIEGMKANAAGLKEELGDAFDASHIQPFLEKVTSFEQNLSTLADAVRQKNDELVASKRKEAEIEARMALIKEKIAEIDARRAEIQSKVLYRNTEKGKNEYETLRAAAQSLGAELLRLEVSLREAGNATAGVEVELGKANDKLAEATKETQGLVGSYGSLTDAAEAARNKQNELNEALARQEAEDAKRRFEELANLIKDGMGLSDAVDNFDAFGDALRDYIDIARNAGLTTQQTAKNLQWMAKNGGDARGVLESLGFKTEEATEFMVKYGDKCIDVARRMAQLGESEEEAAKNVGVLASAVQESTQSLEENTKVIAENHKSLMALASISPTRLKRLTDNLKTLRDALTPPPNQPKIDLGWLSALGSISRLPKLSNVDGWVEKFKKLAEGINGVNVTADLSWVEKLKEFSLPNLGDVKSWLKDFDKWAGGVAKQTTPLEQFATALSSINGSLSALNDATLKIVFKDEALLGRIESHLSTLASLKGVIWA